MKRRFHRLPAVILTASLCVPALPAASMQAANANAENAYWTEEESVPVVTISSKDRLINFNDGWKFNLGDSSTAHETDFNDSSWDNITLPHDFSIFQDFTTSGEGESGFLPGGTGWYRKSFTVPKALDGKTIVLNFDGVYKDTNVYVNGESIGEHHYGYTSFAFDLTDKLICDGKTQNLIAVKADHQLPSSRWYSGSGIFRDVSLIVTNPVHVARYGTFVTTPNLKDSDGTDGTVNIAVEVQNDSDAAADVTVRNTVYKKDGTKVGSSAQTTASVPAGETQTAETSIAITSPDLWSTETPNLYYVQTEILKGSDVIDTYDTEFGFKWFEFVDNQGFYLNGDALKINGVCMHHDQGALGSAAYYDAIYRQMSTMKNMGVNTIRITHNPGSEVLVDICNELGLLVIEEFFDGWAWPKNGNSNDFAKHFNANLTEDNQIIDGNPEMTWAEFVLKSTVKRGRNDASIILWSLGNEINEGCGSNGPWDALADNLIRWTKELDETHPVTSGSNRRSLSAQGDTGVPIVNQKIYEAGGVPGYNYVDLNSMNALHQRYPVMLWSETVSPNNSRGIYTTQTSQANADGKYHLTSYDTSCVGWGKTAHASMYPTLTTDWIAGECVWTGFDYIGEPTPWNPTSPGASALGAAPNSSYFGIVETSGFPKDTYYLYRSQWNQTANTLHLVTAWDPDNMMETNGKTPVWIYSNAAKVELYRNGVKIGTATRKDPAQTTSPMGHVHYEYTTESNNPDLCATTSGTGDTSLYSVFNVAFESGTISAKAFDEDGNDITNTCEGNASVSTPGKASQLVAYSNKESIAADGSSLAYITVDVKDANGNLKTTAGNTIRFTLEGQGEIMGVDNGDQATVDKYQQQSVLFGPKSAAIKAYAGKALVIVRSTRQAGGFTLKAEANNLTGSSVTVNTTSLTDGAPQMTDYKLSKHCYVPTGASAITLPSSVKASFTDGSSKNIPIKMENYDKAQLAEKGNFRINGSFEHEGQTFSFYITVHVYDPIGGVDGFALYTKPGLVPALPSLAMAYDINENEFEEYPVKWDTSSLTEESISEAGNVAVVQGTVDVIGKTFVTQATIRAAEGEDPTQSNVATARDHLVDNGPYNDSLVSVTDGDRTDGDHGGSNRWTTWKNRESEEPCKDISISMDWATATMTDRINLFYYKESGNTSVLPTSVKFEYALSSNYDEDANTLTANEWFEISYAEPTDVEGFAGADRVVAKSYQLNEAINPQALRITFEHPAKSFIGLTEIEVIGTTYSYYPKTSAALTSAKFKDTVIAASLEENGTYQTNAGVPQRIEFDNPNNASLTFIYTNEDHTAAKVIAHSEDGNDTKSYNFTFTDVPTEESKQNLQEKLDSYEQATAEIEDSLKDLESFTALKDALAQISKDVHTMTESELQSSLTDLQAQYKQFYQKAIETKLNEYRSLNAAKYTAESYQQLKKVMDEIDLSKIGDLSETELMQKLNALNDAYAKLKSAALESLEAKLKEFKAIDGSKYTPESYAPFKKLLDEIAQLNLNDLSETELTEKLNALTAAFGNLKQASAPSGEEKPTDSVIFKNVKYQIISDNAAAAISLDNTKAKNIVIQASVTINNKKYNVTQIAANAFKSGKNSLKTVTIGKNVKTIGKNAFNGCKKITKITFKGTALKPCKKNAFKGTKKGVKVIAPKKIAKSKRKNFLKNLTTTGKMKKPKLQYK